jgi:hypothetical protein
MAAGSTAKLSAIKWFFGVLVFLVVTKADAGSASSYFGAVQVIPRVADPVAGERRIRLHPDGDWSMTGKARALNGLAEKLTSWKMSAPLYATPTAAQA